VSGNSEGVGTSEKRIGRYWDLVKWQVVNATRAPDLDGTFITDVHACSPPAMHSRGRSLNESSQNRW